MSLTLRLCTLRTSHSLASRVDSSAERFNASAHQVVVCSRSAALTSLQQQFPMGTLAPHRGEYAPMSSSCRLMRIPEALFSAAQSDQAVNDHPSLMTRCLSRNRVEVLPTHLYFFPFRQSRCRFWIRPPRQPTVPIFFMSQGHRGNQPASYFFLAVDEKSGQYQRMVVHKEENSRTTQKAAHYW